ncbi:hypothetical protein MPC1_600008 [Methylocella tundrae]|nr:hypothetical protein MPC1_600008 [Methylocella tundrae]
MRYRQKVVASGFQRNVAEVYIFMKSLGSDDFPHVLVSRPFSGRERGPPRIAATLCATKARPAPAPAKAASAAG